MVRLARAGKKRLFCLTFFLVFRTVEAVNIQSIRPYYVYIVWGVRVAAAVGLLSYVVKNIITDYNYKDLHSRFLKITNRLEGFEQDQKSLFRFPPAPGSSMPPPPTSPGSGGLSSRSLSSTADSSLSSQQQLGNIIGNQAAQSGQDLASLSQRLQSLQSSPMPSPSDAMTGQELLDLQENLRQRTLLLQALSQELHAQVLQAHLPEAPTHTPGASQEAGQALATLQSSSPALIDEVKDSTVLNGSSRSLASTSAQSTTHLVDGVNVSAELSSSTSISEFDNNSRSLSDMPQGLVTGLDTLTARALTLPQVLLPPSRRRMQDVYGPYDRSINHHRSSTTLLPGSLRPRRFEG